MESEYTYRVGLDDVDFFLVERAPWWVCVIWPFRVSLVF